VNLFVKCSNVLAASHLTNGCTCIKRHRYRRWDQAVSVDMVADGVGKLMHELVIDRMALLQNLRFTPQMRAELGNRMNTIHADVGEKIVQAGETDETGLFFIRSGAVKIIIGDQVVDTLGSGSYFGERALLGEGVRTATVQARVRSELLQLTRDDFQAIVLMSTESANNVELLRRSCRKLIDKVIIPHFPEMEHSEEEMVHAFASRVRNRRYRRGQAIVKQGRLDDDGMFFVVSGEVLVTQRQWLDGQYRQVEVARIGIAGYFGETSILAGGLSKTAQPAPRNATVRCATQTCALLCLPREDMKVCLLELNRIGQLVRVLQRLLLNDAALHEARGDEDPDTMIKSLPLASMHLRQYVWKTSVRREFPKGTIIVKEGDDNNDGLFFVESGSLVVLKNNEHAGDLCTGSIFGEASFLTPTSKRGATVVAQSDDVVLLNLSRAALQTLRNSIQDSVLSHNSNNQNGAAYNMDDNTVSGWDM